MNTLHKFGLFFVILLQLSQSSAKSFTFAVIGDTRPPYGTSSYHTFEEQLQRITSFTPALLINLGDLIYGYGGKPTDSAWKVYDSIIGCFHLPYYQVPGNHDIFSLKAQDEYRRQFHKLYYSFDTAGYHFVMLDNTEDAQWGRIGTQQIEWLEKDLATTKKHKTFVFMHLPAWEQERVGKEHYLLWKDRLHPLFREHGVKAVFAGHVHAYGPTRTIDGIPYFITGGGGAELDKQYAAAGGDFHFMLLTDNDSTLDWRIITDNAVLDESEASVEQNQSFAGKQVRPLLLSYEKVAAKPDQQIQVDVANPYDSVLAGKASWEDIGNTFLFRPGKVDVHIKPHDHARYTFMTRANIWSSPLPVLRFNVSAGGVHHTFTKDLIVRRNFTINSLLVAPAINGKLDDWSGSSQVVLAASRKQAPVATIQTVWNTKALWIAATVQKAPHSHNDTAHHSYPLDDALIIAIDRTLTRSESGNSDLQIEISHNANGIVLYDRAHGEPLNPVESGICAMVSDTGDSVTIYEVQLPETFLRPLALSKHTRFGIDFAVITTDSTGGRTLVSWTPGIGYDGFEASFKSQAHFAEAELK